MGWRGETPAVAQRAPNQATGYYAGGGQLNGGAGSGMGQSVSGRGQFASGNGVTVAGQDWHPTILYLAALVVAEMVAFAYIGRLLSK
jgi:hypothetical protein